MMSSTTPEVPKPSLPARVASVTKRALKRTKSLSMLPKVSSLHFLKRKVPEVVVDPIVSLIPVMESEVEHFTVIVPSDAPVSSMDTQECHNIPVAYKSIPFPGDTVSKHASRAPMLETITEEEEPSEELTHVEDSPTPEPEGVHSDPVPEAVSSPPSECANPPPSTHPMEGSPNDVTPIDVNSLAPMDQMTPSIHFQSVVSVSNFFTTYDTGTVVKVVENKDRLSSGEVVLTNVCKDNVELREERDSLRKSLKQAQEEAQCTQRKFEYTQQEATEQAEQLRRCKQKLNEGAREIADTKTALEKSVARGDELSEKMEKLEKECERRAPEFEAICQVEEKFELKKKELKETEARLEHYNVAGGLHKYFFLELNRLREELRTNQDKLAQVEKERDDQIAKAENAESKLKEAEKSTERRFIDWMDVQGKYLGLLQGCDKNGKDLPPDEQPRYVRKIQDELALVTTERDDLKAQLEEEMIARLEVLLENNLLQAGTGEHRDEVSSDVLTTTTPVVNGLKTVQKSAKIPADIPLPMSSTPTQEDISIAAAATIPTTSPKEATVSAELHKTTLPTSPNTTALTTAPTISIIATKAAKENIKPTQMGSGHSSSKTMTSKTEKCSASNGFSAKEVDTTTRGSLSSQPSNKITYKPRRKVGGGVADIINKLNAPKRDEDEENATPSPDNGVPPAPLMSFVEVPPSSEQH